MTYSIIARCPRTGRFGVGSTTFSMACGRRHESVRPNVGISKSQAFYLRYVDPLDDGVGHVVLCRCWFFSMSANSIAGTALRGLRARSS